MNPIAFAYGIGSDGPDGPQIAEYQLFISEDVEEVFKNARRVLPVRSGFDRRLTEGLSSPQQYYRLPVRHRSTAIVLNSLSYCFLFACLRWSKKAAQFPCLISQEYGSKD